MPQAVTQSFDADTFISLQGPLFSGDYMRVNLNVSVDCLIFKASSSDP